MTRASAHEPPGIPDGWFAVAWSQDLVPGDVHRLRAFGEELALYRSRAGQVHLLEAYCAHLGAHLAEGGRVVGETLRCPFHGWRYDGSGSCVDIPYCKKIPPRARVRAYEVVERNHMVLAWHHAEGKPPSWEVPTLSEFGDPAWTEPRTFELQVAVPLQDMAENNCDPVHFRYVHGNLELPQSEVSYAEDGRFMRMSSRHIHATPDGRTFETTLERDAWGLGLVSVRSRGIPGAGLLMLSSTTPVDAEHAHSRWLFSVTRNMADTAGEEFIEALTAGVRQDLRIWENKIHRARPVLCEGDDDLAAFRRWARQFYS